MIEPTQLGPIVDIAVSITILIGTGAAVNWWLTRRVENRIKDEVNHMDRLQSIESRVTNVEANMATKKDLAEMKADLAEVESAVAGLETKVTGLETKVTGLETKVASMEAKMVTKDDMAAGMNTLKTDLLDAIKNMNGNAHR